MVYESDFYTTRRPYSSRPSYSTYTVSSAPSRQVRILPGLGKVHIVHTYDRIVPYVGHKRLTVVTLPPRVHSTRPSILQKEYDWIENKVRPWVGYSATNRYLNSDSAVRYVYVRNPAISELKLLNYDPILPSSNYYNYYRIYRPLISYDDDTLDFYRPLNFYKNNSWPIYHKLRLLDGDFPSYRSIRLQRHLNNLHRYYYPSLYLSSKYYPDYYYNSFYRYYWPSTASPINYLTSSRYYYWPYYYNYYLPKRYSDYWSKYLPISYQYNSYKFANHLNSLFDDETRLIRAQTASLLTKIHAPVPRIRSWSVQPLNRSGMSWTVPSKYSNSSFIHRIVSVSPNTKVEYSTYYTEPVKKYVGDYTHNRRRPLRIYKDPVQNDIQLLSYYINKFRQEKLQPKEIKVPLSASRPSRIFSVQKPLDDPVAQEIKELRDARAARLAKIYEVDSTPPSKEVDAALKKKKEEARQAEEKALQEEQARKEAKEAQAKKEEAARKAELARQEQLAAQAAAERAAELERQAEKLRQEEAAKQAEIEEKKRQEEEKARLEEQRRLEEEAKAEEERKQLLRLEEIARQAEEEKEAELARQAEELAELARQEAELAELERQEREAKEKAEKEAELAELAKQEAELAELERQEKELAELAKQEAELAEKAQEESAQPDAAEETTLDEEGAAQEEPTTTEAEEATPAEAVEESEPVVEEPAEEAAAPVEEEETAVEEEEEEVEE